jgi:membrane-bound ClpP family serine protease
MLFIATLIALLTLIVFAGFARHKKSCAGALQIVNATGIVEETLRPEGAVLIGGELWLARTLSGTCCTIERGTRVRVAAFRAPFLEVERLEITH